MAIVKLQLTNVSARLNNHFQQPIQSLVDINWQVILHPGNAHLVNRGIDHKMLKNRLWGNFVIPFSGGD